MFWWPTKYLSQSHTSHAKMYTLFNVPLFLSDADCSGGATANSAVLQTTGDHVCPFSSHVACFSLTPVILYQSPCSTIPPVTTCLRSHPGVPSLILCFSPRLSLSNCLSHIHAPVQSVHRLLFFTASAAKHTHAHISSFLLLF